MLHIISHIMPIRCLKTNKPTYNNLSPFLYSTTRLPNISKFQLSLFSPFPSCAFPIYGYHLSHPLLSGKVIHPVLCIDAWSTAVAGSWRSPRVPSRRWSAFSARPLRRWHWLGLPWRCPPTQQPLRTDRLVKRRVWSFGDPAQTCSCLHYPFPAA